MMTKIHRADNDKEIKLIADLAKTIWTEHYTPIIGRDQVEYMLDRFQSETAIRDQVNEGVYYYSFYYNNIPAGYISFYKKEKALFLSKLYVLDIYRGKKIGKAAMTFLEEQVSELGCDRIQLTVNKNNNNSIEAYKKMGFQIIDSIIIDIGNGFVMDDYLMEKIDNTAIN